MTLYNCVTDCTSTSTCTPPQMSLFNPQTNPPVNIPRGDKRDRFITSLRYYSDIYLISDIYCNIELSAEIRNPISWRAALNSPHATRTVRPELLCPLANGFVAAPFYGSSFFESLSHFVRRTTASGYCVGRGVS